MTTINCSVCGKPVKASEMQRRVFELLKAQGTPFVCSAECAKKCPDRSASR